MPSSHQWFAVATTTNTVIAACATAIQRHLLVLILAA
jgi:hypothetical protein